jgi:glutamate-1-semialdehyde 2,1-aminomutase
MSADSAVARAIPHLGGLDQRVRDAHERYSAAHPESLAEQDRARKVIPGGNTRSVLHFDPFPFRVVSAEGSELTDVDGHRYIDFCGNYSAGLLGHSPEAVKKAIVDVLDDGWAVGATRSEETDLAERICDRFASIDQVRFTNSGTEANLMAIGTALHHTGRSMVGVFDGAYHGGVLAFGNSTDGPHHPLNVPHPFHVAEFNSTEGLDALFAEPDLACVLIELVQGSGGCRPVSPAFLTELRNRCATSGTVLIFDEVMTSRLAHGGAQQRFGVSPDMTTLGKYLGGGMTFGAFGGRREIMAEFDPALGGSLTQAGTFNNNVVTIAAATAALDTELSAERLDAVNGRGDRLREDLAGAFEAQGLPMWTTGLGSMLCIHTTDDRLLELFFHVAMDQGLFIARRGFMALSMALTGEDIQRLVDFAKAWSASMTK